jgi:lysozyme family protein
MADFEIYFPKLIQHESPKYTNNPRDKGGPTKYGVTLATWKEHGYDKDGDGKITEKDVMLITREDARMIAKKLYWDFFQADAIANQSLAELIVDWGYNSGQGLVAQKLRHLLSIAEGMKVRAQDINIPSAGDLFDQVKSERINFINAIVAHNPSQMTFFKGWMNRINTFNFTTQSSGKAVVTIGLLFLGWYLFNQ